MALGICDLDIYIRKGGRNCVLSAGLSRVFPPSPRWRGDVVDVFADRNGARLSFYLNFVWEPGEFGPGRCSGRDVAL
jgi:hypothetical protein